MTKARAPRDLARAHRSLTQRHRRRGQYRLDRCAVLTQLEGDRNAAIVEPDDAALLAVDEMRTRERQKRSAATAFVP